MLLLAASLFAIFIIGAMIENRDIDDDDDTPGGGIMIPVSNSI